MTYVKTSQKEMAKTIKWHPRKKINCLTLHLEWHARLQDVPFFSFVATLLFTKFEGLFFILKESRDNIKEMHFSTS